MDRINNEVFDRPIKPVAARALIATVRDIAPYLTIGECCSIVAVVQNAIKRMKLENKKELSLLPYRRKMFRRLYNSQEFL